MAARRRPPRLGWVRHAMRRVRAQRGADAPPVLIRRAPRSPEATLLLRAALVSALVLAVFTVFLLDRDGLKDNIDGYVSLIDVFYFTMVTVTTVGYGDIVPVSDQARLIDAFFVTPVRIFVWLLFLGTAYQLIIQRLIEEWRIMRLQENLDDHVILCGFGHGGSIAADELLARGWDPQRIVVIESDREEVGCAAERGFIGLHGDASSEALLRMAGIDRAHAIIVSVGRDDTTVLIVLTVRAISKRVRIVASVQEAENIKLVRSGGADEIVAPAKFGGFLLADAVKAHGTIAFVTDLLSYDGDCRLSERAPRPEEVGRLAREVDGALIVEVRRNGRRVGCWVDCGLVIQADDVLLAIDGNRV
jgi:voltage-gated potassium channel